MPPGGVNGLFRRRVFGLRRGSLDGCLVGKFERLSGPAGMPEHGTQFGHLRSKGLDAGLLTFVCCGRACFQPTERANHGFPCQSWLCVTFARTAVQGCKFSTSPNTDRKPSSNGVMR
jgi:hypothetical protein